MIKSKFFNTVATAGVLASLVAGLAFAEDHVCLPEDDAKAVLVSEHPVVIVDFTKSSEACLEDFASDVSEGGLVLVAGNEAKAWQDATTMAGQSIQDTIRLQDKKANVYLAYFIDEDGSNTTADNELWANGVQRNSTPISTKNGVPISMISYSADTYKGIINYIHEEGEFVWNKYLKSSVIPN